MQPESGRWRTFAPLLLALSIAARLASTYLTATGATFVDLHVYVQSGAALDHGNLYSFVYRPRVPKLALPFTYPPFAAILFYPLHLLPFDLVALCWQLGIIAALYGCIVLALRMLNRSDWRLAMVWTAVSMWLEPLRSTFHYGQIGVLLMLLVLWAAYSTRWWVSGLLVGVAAAIKLTPAITGFYLLGRRQWKAAGFSAIVFFATVLVSLLVTGDQGVRYFTKLLTDPGRVGAVGDLGNQSWPGVISRIAGHNEGYGPGVLAAIVGTVLLAVLAWRAVNSMSGGEDRLGGLVVVQLVGLTVAPISWTHHWVWVVCVIIWLIHGPAAHQPRYRVGSWVFATAWLAITLSGLPWLLSLATHPWLVSRPWYLSWGGVAYVGLAALTLAWLAWLAWLGVGSRRRDALGSG
jgi:alpha-1,2-mannosyltransferase